MIFVISGSMSQFENAQKGPQKANTVIVGPQKIRRISFDISLTIMVLTKVCCPEEVNINTFANR